MLVVLLTTCGLVLLSVGIHYNALVLLTRLLLILKKRGVKVRRWVAASILGLLAAHVLEISLFAIGITLLEKLEDYGELLGETHDPASDVLYYSFVSYTSLGFGDIVPTGWLRLLTGIETLTGLILIAWSASFLFMQMEQHWEEIDN